jgi:hypothetical protein
VLMCGMHQLIQPVHKQPLHTCTTSDNDSSGASLVRALRCSAGFIAPLAHWLSDALTHLLSITLSATGMLFRILW